jgi:lipopolysaccharide biosynthesis regulator YciM
MQFETWWLLVIPLFFGLGWIASGLERLGGARRWPSRLPDAYFKGLNFLLNEQSDRAVDAFIEVVRIEPDTVELHFALGSLFRRRGETDRAIRVHQNLAERADLPVDQREQALYELGEDYLKAGLIDRAETVFNRLAGSRYAPAALRQRLEIAQRVRDWPAAIELAGRLDEGAGLDERRALAHFHCELAAQALAGQGSDRFEVCRRELAKALEVDANHARALMLCGQAAMAEPDPQAAIQHWERLAQASPAHMALIASEWLQAHEALGRLGHGMGRLQGLLDTHPSVDVLSALLQARVRSEGAGAARRWAEQALRGTPSVLALDALLTEQTRGVTGLGPDAQGLALIDHAELVRVLIQAQVQRLSRYVCGHCGFKARQFYWQCPGCSRWDSYVPRRAEELERG